MFFLGDLKVIFLMW